MSTHFDIVHPTIKFLAALMESFGLSEEYFNKEISDVHLDQISRSYCGKWRELYCYLELDEILVSDMDHMIGSEEEKRRKFFAQWKEKKGSDVTYRRLLDALLEIGCRKDAEAICKLIPSDS